LYEWRPHLAYLQRHQRWIRIAADVAKHMRRHKRIPLLPTIPRMIRDRRVSVQYDLVFPEWMSPELVERVNLRERWEHVTATSGSLHPTRPRGYASFSGTLWTSLFECYDPAWTGVPLEVRHPYVDIRLL